MTASLPVGARALPPGALKRLRSRLYQAISPAEIVRRLELDPARVRRELRGQVLALIKKETFILSSRQQSLLIESVLDDVLGLDLSNRS